MKKLITYTALAVMAFSTVPVVEAQDRDRDRRDDDRRYSDRDRYRDDDRDDDRDRRRYRGDRTRTIYVIERDRPVQRVVYIDDRGRYYQTIRGQRVYVRGRYYESYPSRYYYPSGKRRVTIRLPFF